MVQLTEEELRCQQLYRVYNESESKIKSDAMVNRAYVDKISVDTINKKVSSQMNSIKTEIHNINPKFKEGSKHYDSTKKLVTETLNNYENVLSELSKFYDGKIEQLILRKVELESSLISAILNEEYLSQKIIKKSKLKENDTAKKSITENIKSVFEKFKSKKENKNEVDPKLIANMLDSQDIAIELEKKLENGVEKSKNDKASNKDFILSTEKEIVLIDNEIKRLNERKMQSIYDAMEIGTKELAVDIKKPKMFSKITRFFVSRFNTAKVIENTIINPLNLRIENFKNNELLNMN